MLPPLIVVQFDIVVENISVETVDEKGIAVKIANPWAFSEEKGKNASSLLPQYPKTAKLAIQVSGSVANDWIGTEDAGPCIQLRHAWSTYYAGENSWKRDRRTYDWIVGKPLSPPWNGNEMEIMGLLLNSDCKFKKSWNHILQYAFVDRSESATSMKWYQLKGKCSYMIEYHGRGMTNQARIQLAKRLAKKHMTNSLDRGCPVKDLHPNANLEQQLRKRGMINDDTDASERKRLCAMYRDYHDSEWDDF